MLMAASALRRLAARPLAAILQQRVLSSLPAAIPVGASPQILLTAFGKHKSGAVRSVSDLLYQHGASIAATKKVVVADHFAMLVSVYTPDDPVKLSEAIMEVAEGKLGFPLTVQLLDLADDAEPTPSAPEPAQRRLKLVCPQRPGIVLAITELLKDYGCALSAIDADTIARKDEIWFELECTVELPSGIDSTQVEADLRFWTEAQDVRAELIFDRWLPKISPLSHA